MKDPIVKPWQWVDQAITKPRAGRDRHPPTGSWWLDQPTREAFAAAADREQLRMRLSSTVIQMHAKDSDR